MTQNNFLNTKKDSLSINPEIGKWFKESRESYEWPLESGRLQSEEKNIHLCSSLKKAILEGDKEALRYLMIDIHRWKTKNRYNQTSKYHDSLESQGQEYLTNLFGFLPCVNTQNLRDLINYLKIDYCNLPICTAIASFLCSRKNVPILDKFVAQFFAWKFMFNSIDERTSQVLSYVKKINFQLEFDGIDSIRLAVYSPVRYDYNLNRYLYEFVPECMRISKDLNELGIRYNDIHGRDVEFLPIDVEMAVFSWAVKHHQ